jgi:hypothetical protein
MKQQKYYRMNKMSQNDDKKHGEDDHSNNIGLIFRKLESIENFFPCYKKMIEK